MRQLQLRLAAKTCMITLPERYERRISSALPSRSYSGRTAITDTVRYFVIVISTTLPAEDMVLGWLESLRMNTKVNFSSNQANTMKEKKTVYQNAMDRYVINNGVNHYNHGIKESMFGDKYYTPRARTRSSTPRTDVNYAKKEDENGDKLNVDMMLM
jgi:hypothetical protein